MSVGQRIAQKRKELGLSQEALGDRLGVSRQSIYKWESDTALPEIEKLIILSKLFSVSVGWLLGVEDVQPESAAPETGGELTETQLKMVEEIVSRYIAAHPAPKPRRKWPWVLACIALILASYTLFQRLAQLDQRYQALQSDFWRVQETIGYEINGISDQVEKVLKAQNSLTADYGTELFSTNLRENRALFHAYAVPKTFQENMTVRFSISDGKGGSNTVPGELGLNGKYTATLAEQLTDYIEISVRFTYPDGTTQTQLLDTYEGLYSDSLPDVDIMDHLMFAPLAGDGSFVIPAADSSPVEYVLVKPASGNAGTAAIADIRMGLFKNNQLLAWAEPCAMPDSFEGFDEYDCFRLPDMTVPLTAKDELCAAAVITDEYGREAVSPGMPYIQNPDGETPALVWPDNLTYDRDPSHWTYR